MAGYNKVIMVGNLTRDPELRVVGTQSVCKLNIASNRQYKNKQSGSLVQEVCFIDVEVWGAQADSCKLYLQKGKPILVEGRIKLDSWKDTEGNARSKHGIVSERIVFLSSSDQQGTEDGLDASTENSTGGIHNQKINEEVQASVRGSRDSAKRGGKKSSVDVFSDLSAFNEDELPF